MISSVVRSKGTAAGRRVIIVATGPSYDDVPREVYEDETVFALNFAITEFKEHPDCYWICHDLWTCLPRYKMERRIAGYNWRLVTRRCYMPGPIGRVDWRQKGGARVRTRFQWHVRRMPKNSKIWWYNEFDDMPGYVRNGNTVLELALEVATIWGFSEAVIVGADMGKVDGRPYARPWAEWKPCKIQPSKFREMRASLARSRPRWPLKITTLSPHWRGPFEPETVEDFMKRKADGR